MAYNNLNLLSVTFKIQCICQIRIIILSSKLLLQTTPTVRAHNNISCQDRFECKELNVYGNLKSRYLRKIYITRRKYIFGTTIACSLDIYFYGTQCTTVYVRKVVTLPFAWQRSNRAFYIILSRDVTGVLGVFSTITTMHITCILYDVLYSILYVNVNVKLTSPRI